jgi:predicted AAA+ superfamily ATPase
MIALDIPQEICHTGRMNFQAESKISGDRFEALVLEDMSRFGYTDIDKNVVIEGTGCEVDFVTTHRGQRVLVEAKGGKVALGKRPGAQRTDNVKKAIASGAIIKTLYPDYKFVVYFSDLPKHGLSSHKMIKTAIRAGFIDQVIYLIESDKVS